PCYRRLVVARPTSGAMRCAYCALRDLSVLSVFSVAPLIFINNFSVDSVGSVAPLNFIENFSVDSVGSVALTKPSRLRPAQCALRLLRPT
ncbi:MAG: hypothetical protein P8124_14030, partial [Gammaproteobacteria bacterium]